MASPSVCIIRVPQSWPGPVDVVVLDWATLGEANTEKWLTEVAPDLKTETIILLAIGRKSPYVSRKTGIWTLVHGVIYVPEKANSVGWQEAVEPAWLALKGE